MPFENYLRNIKNASAEIWRNQHHRNYTDHGVVHSERIIAKLEDLEIIPNGNPGMMLSDLTPLECFILRAAGYLHDVGMQCVHPVLLREIAGIDEKEETLSDGSLNAVRGKHAELSYHMILNPSRQADNRYEGLPDLGLAGINYLLAAAIANVCKAHTASDYAQFCQENAMINGESVRVRLLAVLLRLGDALDADTTRCNWDFYRTVSGRMSVFSQANFWKHHLVAGISIRYRRIKFIFAIPERFEKAKTGIVYMAEKPIRSHVADLKTIWSKYGLVIGIEDAGFEDCLFLPDQMSEELIGYFSRLLVMEKINRKKNVWQSYWEEMTNQYINNEETDKPLKDYALDLEIADSPYGKTNRRSFMSAAREMLQNTGQDAILLLGNRGTGKTTLMKLVAGNEAKAAMEMLKKNVLSREWLPIWVDMKKFPYKNFGDFNISRLLNMVYNLNPILKQLKPDEFLTEKDGILLILDGLDETEVKGENAIKWVNLFKPAPGDNFHFIVASLPDIFPHHGIFSEKSQPFDFPVKRAYIQDMTEAAAGQIAKRCFAEDSVELKRIYMIISSRYVKEIFKTPLELTYCMMYLPFIKQDMSKFSDAAKLVIFYGVMEAGNAKYKLLCTIHIFIALTKMENGYTQRFILKQGGNPKKIRNGLRMILMSRTIFDQTQQTGISERFEKILGLAVIYSEHDKSSTVEEKHLLQAFFEHGGESKEILKKVLNMKLPETMDEIFSMFPEYTKPAKQAWEFAKAAAQQHFHDMVTTSHLLIGLAGVENGFTQNTFKEYNVEPKAIRDRLFSILAKGNARPNMNLRISKRLFDIINLAQDAAKKESVDERHLLWAILKNGHHDNNSQTINIMREFDLDPEKIMEAAGINEG